MAVALEKQLKRDLEHLWIGAKLLADGDDSSPPLERLEWMRSILDDAVDVQKRIDARDARKARLWAKQSTCDPVVHGMPIDTPEWAERRREIGR